MNEWMDETREWGREGGRIGDGRVSGRKDPQGSI